MSEHAFPRCAPEEVGVSSRQVMACIRALEHDQTTMNGFVAARHGKVFAECWWSPYEPELVHCNHSLGKSYTATAVGIAIREGKLSLDTRLCDLFSAEIAERGPRALEIRGVDAVRRRIPSLDRETAPSVRPVVRPHRRLEAAVLKQVRAGGHGHQHRREEPPRHAFHVVSSHPIIRRSVRSIGTPPS